jgi:hypothetical protein
LEELKSEKRLFLSAEKRIVLRDKIEKFAKMHNVPMYMANLFIDEVRMSNDEANKHLREKAELIGLM